MNTKRKKAGLKGQLLLAFVLTSIIPMILANLFSYFNTSGIVRDNVQELTHSNLLRTKNSLDILLESYEDLLFQLYADDDIVEQVDRINRGEDLAVSKNQLRRTLHGLFYTKEYIRCISILTEEGTVVFYDSLTGSSTRNSWMDTAKLTAEEMRREISKDNETHIFPTQKAVSLGDDTYYLFHLGHRLIDYRDVNKQLGAVVISIDEKLLGSACRDQGEKERFNFIADRNGCLVSYPDQSLLTTPAISWEESPRKRKEQYEAFLQEREAFQDAYLSVDLVHDEAFGWDIVNVSSQEETVARLNSQQRITLTVLGISLGALTVVILILIRRLGGSLQKVVEVMKKAGRGDLAARVDLADTTSREAETIAEEFNHMMGRLSRSLEKEREAGERQRKAEIAALEAQINPHFLYNTLDTINWMAIDKEEYEISSSISALAHILRYGIDNSNGIVTLREETDWLKKYLFLQQTRLKNTFQCEIHVEPELMEKRIHKLLLQPFVENAILHGFEGMKRTHFLSVTVSAEANTLRIEIYDNGKGIPQELVEKMNRGEFPKSEQKNHIGIENAISRIQMYYGEEGKTVIHSREGEWTRIEIRIPMEEEKYEDSGY